MCLLYASNVTPHIVNAFLYSSCSMVKLAMHRPRVQVVPPDACSIVSNGLGIPRHILGDGFISHVNGVATEVTQTDVIRELPLVTCGSTTRQQMCGRRA